MLTLESGGAGFAAIFGSDASTGGNATNTLQPEDSGFTFTSKQGVMISLATGQLLYCVLMIACLIYRYGVQKKTADQTPSGNSIFMLRIVSTVLSAIAAGLIYADPEAESPISLIGLLVLTAVGIIAQPHEKLNAKQGGRAALMAPSRYQPPHGQCFNSDYQFQVVDVRILWRSMVRAHRPFAIADDALHYLLTHEAASHERLLVAPPMINVNEGVIASFESGIGRGHLGLYFDKRLATTLPRDIFDELDDFAIAQPRLYKVLFPVQGLNADAPGAWSTIEVKITAHQQNAHPVFDIEIYNHNPSGGGILTAAQYRMLAGAIYQRLTHAEANGGLAIPQQRLRFKARPGVDYLNVHAAMHPAEGDAEPAEAPINPAQMLQSPYATPRLEADQSHASAMVVLDDLSHCLVGNPLAAVTYSAQKLASRQRYYMSSPLVDASQADREAFRSRITMDAPAATAVTEVVVQPNH